MSLTSLALANLHSEHRQANVSRYVAEQIVLRNSHRSFGNFDWQKENLGYEVMTCTTHASSKIPEPSFQKRVRHKMREDPVYVSMDLNKPSRGTGSGTSGIASRSKVKKVKRAKGLVKSSTVEDITGKRARLTLKSHHSLGLFKNGRASAQVEKRGLPDLTFCEMAFLQGSDKRNTPELSKTPSSITNSGTRDTDGYQKMPLPFTSHSVDQESASVVSPVTNLIIHPTDETPIQQTAHDNYPRISPLCVPLEAPSLTERNDITDIERSKGCRAAVNSEESHEEGPAAGDEQPLSIPQQARPAMLQKLYNGGVSRPLEIPDPAAGMATGQVKGGPCGDISGEDPTCQRSKVSNATIKRHIRSPSPLSSLLHACDNLLSYRMPLSTSPSRGREVNLRAELPSSALPLSWRPIPCHRFHDSAEAHPQDISILVEHSETDTVQNYPLSASQWYMRKRSDDSTKGYSFAGINTQYGPGFPDYIETRMEVAYPSYTEDLSPFMDDEIHVCNSELYDYGDDNSVVSENDFSQNAKYNTAVLGASMDMGDAQDEGNIQALRSAYSYDSAEDSYGQLVDIGSSYRSLRPIEEPMVDTHTSTFCWRPYWRT
ncbi:hypothetical protein EV426DRAFT_599053 [Tirmania nivea]|nr:hypothetical protein EV426DRAFT_599053 [Tirmania nivea]